MLSVFCSYSHKDERFREQLVSHLKPLERQGIISTWHERTLAAGDHIDSAIDAALDRADIILLLVSADFLASEYCYSREMTRALARHEAGAARAIPIILRPCDWHDAPFGALLASPTDGIPVTKWHDQDEAFLNIATAIRTAANQMIANGKTNSGGTLVASSARSSNQSLSIAEIQGAAPAHMTYDELLACIRRIVREEQETKLSNEDVRNTTQAPRPADRSRQKPSSRSSIIDELIAQMGAAVGPNSGLGGTLKFDFGQTGSVLIDGKSQPNRVMDGEGEPADCTINLSMKTFEELVKGELDGTAAFMSGKMRISGNMGVAMKLAPVLQNARR